MFQRALVINCHLFTATGSPDPSVPSPSPRPLSATLTHPSRAPRTCCPAEHTLPPWHGPPGPQGHGLLTPVCAGRLLHGGLGPHRTLTREWEHGWPQAPATPGSPAGAHGSVCRGSGKRRWPEQQPSLALFPDAMAEPLTVLLCPEPRERLLLAVRCGGQSPLEAGKPVTGTFHQLRSLGLAIVLGHSTFLQKATRNTLSTLGGRWGVQPQAQPRPVADPGGPGHLDLGDP